MDKIKLVALNDAGTYARDYNGEEWGVFTGTIQATCVVCGKSITRGWLKGQLGESTYYCCSDHIKLDATRLYIVTRAHNQDYISATAFLTKAEDEREAIINCMRYNGDLDGYLSPDIKDDKDDPELQAELTRLRKLSLRELEQDDRDSGNVWHAEVFKLPENMKPGDVKQIAELDTD